MHKLHDPSQIDSEHYQNYYNHENCTVRVLTNTDGKRSLEVNIFNLKSENYERIYLSETKENHWLALIDAIGDGVHLPAPADADGGKAYKLHKQVLKADEKTPEALAEKVRLLEEENAKKRK